MKIFLSTKTIKFNLLKDKEYMFKNIRLSIKKCINVGVFCRFDFYKDKYIRLWLNRISMTQIYNSMHYADFRHETNNRYYQIGNYKLMKVLNSMRINKMQKTKRVSDRIKEMISCDNCYFCTFTFNDDILNSTNKATRRKYIRRILKLHCSNYIANIDYGDLNHREHYHAVVLLDSDINYNYGYFSVLKVRNNTDDKKLSNYLTKLKNHALKESTENERIIYARRKDVKHCKPRAYTPAVSTQNRYI